MQQYGWIYQATLLADHERIKLEEVYQLTTITALNGLAYIKSKHAHDADSQKQAYAKH